MTDDRLPWGSAYASESPRDLGRRLTAPCRALAVIVCIWEICLVGCSRGNATSDGPLRPSSASERRQSADKVVNSIGIPLVRVDVESFPMGAAASPKGEADESPVHDVEFSYTFYVGMYEIRRKEFLALMKPTVNEPKSPQSDSAIVADDDQPMTSISWEETQEFCSRLSALPAERLAGRIYRLPTEAEWECCCRAGTTTAYSVGNDLPLNAACFTAKGSADKPARPVRVGSFPSNSFGIYDMHGNAWEWCLDWYQADYYRVSPKRDPRGPEKGTRRVIRGGGWNSLPELCRSSFRDGKEPVAREAYLGFRVVCLQGMFLTDLGVPKNEKRPNGGPTTSASDSDRPAHFTVAEIVARIEPSVVRIDTSGPRANGSGSGFLLFRNDLVLTNYHVIEAANRAQAQFSDGTTSTVTGAMWKFPDKDLALLQLDKPHPGAKPLELASSVPKKGEATVAYGAPLGLSFSASDGIVSAVRTRQEMQTLGLNFGPQVTWVQTTTPISPGNSGGPLFNEAGKVIGVNTIVLSGRPSAPGQNLNFAVACTEIPPWDSNHPPTCEPLRDEATNTAENLRRLIESLGGIAP